MIAVRQGVLPRRPFGTPLNGVLDDSPLHEFMAKKLGILEPDHDMEAVIAHLRGLGIAFERSPVVLDLAKLPPDLAKLIKGLPKGEPFVLPTGRTITINVVVGP